MTKSLLWDDAAMESESPAKRYRREAEDCRRNAGKAMRADDRDAWLWLATDWAKLAQTAELNPRSDRPRD